MLSLPGRGLNLAGMDSHDLRPMITALSLPVSCVSVVLSLKNFMSRLIRHGRPPLIPIPRDSVAATIICRRGFILGLGNEKRKEKKKKDGRRASVKGQCSQVTHPNQTTLGTKLGVIGAGSLVGCCERRERVRVRVGRGEMGESRSRHKP